jgi:hypothetical protein
MFGRFLYCKDTNPWVDPVVEIDGSLREPGPLFTLTAVAAPAANSALIGTVVFFSSLFCLCFGSELALPLILGFICSLDRLVAQS